MPKQPQEEKKVSINNSKMTEEKEYKTKKEEWFVYDREGMVYDFKKAEWRESNEKEKEIIKTLTPQK